MNKVKSLNIDDPVVVRQELLKDYTFAIYSKVSAIINTNGTFQYILWDGNVYGIEHLDVPTQEELISYFGFAGDVRTRSRELINK
jgi:hypothetical protein